MDPETHKEIVEIKRHIREINQTIDVSIQHDREKNIKLLDDAINNDRRTAEILLLVDGFKSRKDIQDATGMPQASCWRKIDRLVSKEVIMPLEETKNNSPVYQQSRWFTKLRLEEYVRDKYMKEEKKEVNNGTTNTEPNQDQNL